MKQGFPAVKKTLVLALIVSISAGYATAQQQRTSTEAGLTPRLGAKGGINLTNLYVDDVEDENMKVGFNVGLFAKMPVSNGLSIQPEVLYSVKGSQVTYDLGVLGTNTYRFNLNYVEIPLLAIINLSKNFNFHVGGYIAYLAQANIKRENNDGPNDQIANLNEDNFNRFDYGVIGGLGIDIETVTIGARYNYGLREIGKSGTFGSTALSNAKNSAISLYIGFGF